MEEQKKLLKWLKIVPDSLYESWCTFVRFFDQLSEARNMDKVHPFEERPIFNIQPWIYVEPRLKPRREKNKRKLNMFKNPIPKLI